MKTFITGATLRNSNFRGSDDTQIDFTLSNEAGETASTSTRFHASFQPFPESIVCSGEDETQTLKPLLSRKEFILSTYMQKAFGIWNLEHLSWLSASSQLRGLVLGDEGEQQFSTLWAKITDRLNTTIAESDPEQSISFDDRVYESLNFQYKMPIIENESFLDLASSSQLISQISAAANAQNIAPNSAACAFQPQPEEGRSPDANLIRNVRYSDWEQLNHTDPTHYSRHLSSPFYCSRNTNLFYSPSKIFDAVTSLSADNIAGVDEFRDLQLSKYRNPVFVCGHLLTDLSVSIHNLHDYEDFVTSIPSSVLDQLDIIDLPSDTFTEHFAVNVPDSADDENPNSQVGAIISRVNEVKARRETQVMQLEPQSWDTLPITSNKIRAIKLSRLFRGGSKPVKCAFKSITKNQIRSGNSFFAVSTPVKLWNEAGTELVEKKLVFLATFIPDLMQTQRSAEWTTRFSKALWNNDSTALDGILYPELRIQSLRNQYPEITRFIHDEYMPMDDTAFIERKQRWDSIEDQFIENNSFYEHLFSEPEDNVAEQVNSSMLEVLQNRTAGNPQIQRLTDQKAMTLEQIQITARSINQTEEYKEWEANALAQSELQAEIEVSQYYIERNQSHIEDLSLKIQEMNASIEEYRERIEARRLRIQENSNSLADLVQKRSSLNDKYEAVKKSYDEQISVLSGVAERIEQKIQAVKISSIPEGLLEQRKKALENFMEANSIEIFKFNPDAEELAFAINMPIAININRHTAENSEETRTVYGGPYRLKLDHDALSISALNPSTLFGFMQDSDINIVLHPHSPSLNIQGDTQFSLTSTCVGSAAGAIRSGWNSGDITILLQAVMAWVTSAVSSDEWGRKYKYLPKKVRLEESEPEQDENVQVQAQ